MPTRSPLPITLPAMLRCPLSYPVNPGLILVTDRP